MRVVGMDENGLGPRLGPMVVTGCAIEVPHYKRDVWMTLGKGLGLDDSKATGGFGKMAAIESVALAMATLNGGPLPEHVDAWLQAISYDAVSTLKSPCPPQSQAQCWASAMPLPAFGGDVKHGLAVLDALANAGCQVLGATSQVFCAGELNRRFALGQNKLAIDLESFENLAERFGAHAKDPCLFVCGMVGGIRNYPRYFRKFPWVITLLPEDAGERCDPRALGYDIPNLGQMWFEIDADANHLPVALASMVGKYTRELLMLRQMTFYKTFMPDQAPVSGYHDPRTRGFVEASAKIRKRLNIADACFERTS